MSGRAKKRWSGSGARSGGIRERERSGERTKLAALRGLLLRGESEREREGHGLRGIRGRGRQAKENEDHPPTIFGLKVALPILQYFGKICPARGLALRCRL